MRIVDLLGVLEDSAGDEVQFSGNLFEGLAGEEFLFDLRAALVGLARGRAESDQTESITRVHPRSSEVASSL
jgi:hypothetical protein